MEEPGGGGQMAVICTSSDKFIASSNAPGSVCACKWTCDKQRFFDCNDAAEQSACYYDCENSTDSKREVYLACVKNVVCDSQCRVGIKPAQAPTNPTPSAPPDTKTPDTCKDLCNKYATDGCSETSKDRCLQGCDDEQGRQYISYCFAQRKQCMLPDECDPFKETCKDICAASGGVPGFSCIPQGAAASCTSRCDKADRTVVKNFVTCAGTGVSCDASCYPAFDPDFKPVVTANVAGCKAACDKMKSNLPDACLDATQHSDCRTKCETASAAKIDTFRGCVQCDDLAGKASCFGGRCSDAACYTTFVK
jgi:hypothetical protein